MDKKIFTILRCLNQCHYYLPHYHISPPKYMLRVLKRMVSVRRFFWAPKTYGKQYGKENIYNLMLKIFVYLNQCQYYLSHLGDNCIQNFHLGRYIVGYTVGNLVLRWRISGALKHDFRMYIRRYTSPNENFEYGYPHSNALYTFSLQKDSENVLCCAYTSSGCQLHETACQLHIFTCQPMKRDVTKLRRVSDSISQDIL